jgi:hypothetical protein
MDYEVRNIFIKILRAPIPAGWRYIYWYVQLTGILIISSVFLREIFENAIELIWPDRPIEFSDHKRNIYSINNQVER